MQQRGLAENHMHAKRFYSARKRHHDGSSDGYACGFFRLRFSFAVGGRFAARNLALRGGPAARDASQAAPCEFRFRSALVRRSEERRVGKECRSCWPAEV